MMNQSINPPTEPKITQKCLKSNQGTQPPNVAAFKHALLRKFEDMEEEQKPDVSHTTQSISIEFKRRRNKLTSHCRNNLQNKTPYILIIQLVFIKEKQQHSNTKLNKQNSISQTNSINNPQSLPSKVRGNLLKIRSYF